MYGRSRSGGEAGSHRTSVLLAVLAIASGFAAVGSERATADTPAVPYAQITSPADGTGVQVGPIGYFNVYANGKIDPSGNDVIQSMDLIVDRLLQKPVTVPPGGGGCGGGQVQCSATYGVNAKAWTTGTHTLEALIYTQSGKQVLSPAVTVHLFSPTSVAFSPQPSSSQGEKLTVTGMVSSPSGAGVPGQPVTVHFAPVYGTPRSVNVTTNSSGLFQTPYTLTSNTVITANVPASQRWGASSATTSLTAGAEPDCAVAHSSVKHGQSDTITCKLPGLPSGVSTTLTYVLNKKTYTYGHGHSTGSKATFTFKLKKTGKVVLFVAVAGNKTYGPGTGTAKVTVK